MGQSRENIRAVVESQERIQEKIEERFTKIDHKKTTKSNNKKVAPMLWLLQAKTEQVQAYVYVYAYVYSYVYSYVYVYVYVNVYGTST